MLPRKALLPTEHIVDTGYVDAKLLVERKLRLPDRLGRTDPKKLSLVSLSLSHRLGTATGSLSAGTHQHQLDSGQGPPEKRGEQDQVLDHRLPGVPISISLLLLASMIRLSRVRQRYQPCVRAYLCQNSTTVSQICSGAGKAVSWQWISIASSATTKTWKPSLRCTASPITTFLPGKNTAAWISGVSSNSCQTRWIS
jgi:hypothetical protein